ncbi:MAG: tRNA 2-thiocytidine biosynthesis protein TtcA [Chlamydiae bacterium]|nr:tRNA 2-thiocytidine biosynthesis protein TtcA [Chlamydiota bacterium]
MTERLLKTFIPLATPPWTKLGKRIESMTRKALYDFKLLEGVDSIAVALSGGKDSLSMLFMLCAISGRGFPNLKITAIHVDGEFSCGAGVNISYLKNICKLLNVEFITCRSTQTRENLECYSCSRERRRLIFDAAKNIGSTTIAFGHHRDDSIQTLLMNLFHKGEFAANLPKIHMQDYGVTIIRPFIYISEQEVLEFAKLHGFARITCQCPVGQNSLRKQTEEWIKHLEKTFPNIRTNLSQASLNYASDKALKNS